MSNVKIALIPIIVIIIAFSLLGFLKLLDFEDRIIGGGQVSNPYYLEKSFFESDFSESRTMFLLGSSQVAASNVTQVNDIIKNKDISVYNLAKAGNTPTKRIQEVNDIISLNPEIIFYGISYRDFKFPFDYVESILPSAEQINSCSLEEFFISNPELLTRYFLKTISNERDGIILKTYMKNTPFYDYKPVSIPNSLKIDEESIENKKWVKHCHMSENTLAINSIISKLQSNNIKVVIFTTPLDKFYLKSLSNSQKDQFKELLEGLTEKYGIEIYEFEEKYSELNVWKDPNHVSYHESVTIYNEDIASMIIKESDP